MGFFSTRASCCQYIFYLGFVRKYNEHDLLTAQDFHDQLLEPKKLVPRVAMSTPNLPAYHSSCTELVILYEMFLVRYVWIIHNLAHEPQVLNMRVVNGFWL